jgi:hypothetical protein
MRRLAGITGVSAALVAALVALPSLAPAAPIDDYNIVRADWAADTVITPCKFTLSQLGNARGIATTADAYTDFPTKLDAEIARQHAGVCAGSNQPAAGATLRATVSPTRAKFRKKITLTITVTTTTAAGRRVPVKNVVVRFLLKRPKTNAKGQAKITYTFTRVMTHKGSVALNGFKTSIFSLRVVR